jgi:hypothetical protein
MNWNLCVELSLDAWLLGCCICCYRNARRLKQSAQKMDAYVADGASVVIDALENLAVSTCPCCAVAAAKGELQTEAGCPVEAEPEIDGIHNVTINGDQTNLPCLAAKARADAKDLFAKSMARMEASNAQVKRAA